ncbi:MAG TPA: protein phosphatase CheZ [Burkholderiales bacterium]|nr:protein phosphatase CheZ [Burkholderiales bacterium]
MEENMGGGMQKDDTNTPEALLSRVGHVTRDLHDSLRALGLDKTIQEAAHDIPDVRDRLNYVVEMTEKAAERVLNATDMAIPLQEKIAGGGNRLIKSLETLDNAPFDETVYRNQMASVLIFLREMVADADASKQQLMDIMMAQDFQDLTGQVIRKIISLAHNLEVQLVQLLLDYAPLEMKRENGAGLMNGPQINPAGKEDIVADQGQVDDLLSSLGF